MNKNKVIIFSIAAASIAVAAFAFFSFQNKETGKPTQITYTDSAVGLKNDLPALKDVNPSKSPILYDFVNSSLGFKSNIDGSKNINSIFFVKTPKGNWNAESYINVSGSATPVLGTKTMLMIPSNSRLFENKLQTLDSDHKFTEGKYKFYILPMNQIDHYGKFGGEDLGFFMETDKLTETPGLFETEMLYTGGWPSSWLRKTPYKQRVLEEYAIDLNDKFWDEHNYKELQVFKAKDMPDLEVRTVGIDSFEFETISGETNTVNEKQLQRVLEDSGYSK